MPICEEPVDRVFAGLRAIYASLERTGEHAPFDFFILSDSSNPDTWVREEEAWAAWCREVGGFGRIFYRRRRVRLERKSGNVADFLRRWGRQYRYMVMLDADSIMSGQTLLRLVQMMERHPDAGMIQTAPVAVNRRSLLARAQQFSGRVYGPMFAAGLHFWQLGDGQYWGHNTIIRVAPFMDHCALPRLPGKPPLGGEILSHDFVEAALMGRAGWTLWLAFDLDGSYEEVPSTLLEEMKRDRRWCQGNLQHLRLLFSEGLFGAHRALFLNGALSYVSAGLWSCFLWLSTAEAIVDVMSEPDYFPHGASLFPEWPVWRPDWALSLLAVTATILFLPKVLSVVLIVLRGQAYLYGGVVRLSLSVLLEIILSSLLAPIRMVFHTRFVLTNLLGRTVVWRSQGRDDSETRWGEAIRQHGLDSLIASAWGLTLYWLNPDYFWWVTPIVGALILAVPVSVLSSRVRWGDWFRARGLFRIPEETSPPPEIAAVDSPAESPAVERDGLVRAAVDPFANALRVALARGKRSRRASVQASRAALMERALAEGPAALEARQRTILLSDPECAAELHRRVWQLPEDRAAAWGLHGR
jgi:membrane glycosyltransferase